MSLKGELKKHKEATVSENIPTSDQCITSFAYFKITDSLKKIVEMKNLQLEFYKA